MNYPSLLYITVPSGQGNTVLVVCARGHFIREPKVGHINTLSGLPCDINCHGLILEMDMVEENLGEEYLFVRFKEINIQAAKLTVEPEDLAEQISANLKAAGWLPCDDSGRYKAA